LKVSHTLNCHQSHQRHQGHKIPLVDQVKQSYLTYLFLCVFEGHWGPIL
jgi:hypothetical protein